jgi:hypothetical protein
MKIKLQINKNKHLPDGVIACHYIDEVERNEATKNNRPFHPYFSTTEYFMITKETDLYSFEGYMGRTDGQATFFEDFDPTITYFKAYEKRQDVYLTFDNINLFKLSHILPRVPLLFKFQKLNLNTMEEENKSSIHTNITAGDGNIITTGSNNSIKMNSTIVKNDLNSLRQELTKLNVSESDIEEISLIVQEEHPDHTGKFKAKTNGWIGKMLQKSLDGTWDLGIATAGGILAELLKAYFHIP